MPVKRYRPTSAGRRNMSVSDFAELTRGKSERSLTKGLVAKSGGRNVNGRITTYHRGGGHKRLFRQIDFRRNKVDVPAKVAAIDYDPNRSANIALLHYVDGEKRYILAPNGLLVGATVMSSAQGLAVESYVEDLEVTHDGDLVHMGRPSGLALSPASASISPGPTRPGTAAAPACCRYLFNWWRADRICIGWPFGLTSTIKVHRASPNLILRAISGRHSASRGCAAPSPLRPRSPSR